MNERFSFEKAFELMKKGYKVKLPTWGGYWYWDAEEETIVMHTKDGEELDIRNTQRVEYTLKNILSCEWMIANEKNCTELGGEVTFGFEDALKYMRRGLKVRRKVWSKETELRLSVEIGRDLFGKEVTVSSFDGKDESGEFTGYVPNIADILEKDWCFCDCDNVKENKNK